MVLSLIECFYSLPRAQTGPAFTKQYSLARKAAGRLKGPCHLRVSPLQRLVLNATGNHCWPSSLDLCGIIVPETGHFDPRILELSGPLTLLMPGLRTLPVKLRSCLCKLHHDQYVSCLCMRQGGIRHRTDLQANLLNLKANERNMLLR